MRRKMTRRRLLALSMVPALLTLGFTLSGCNTAEGFGHDVENTGEAIKNEAKDAKD